MSPGRVARHLAPVLAGLAVLAGALAWPALTGDEVDERPAATTAGPTDDAPGAAEAEEPADPAAACIEAWPLRRRVGQLVAVAVDGGALSSEAGRVADLGVGAVLLQRPATDGLAAGVADLKAGSAIPPLVMVDEEGGEVQALSGVLGPIPSPARMVDGFDPQGAGRLVAEHARGVARLGIDVVLGPVVDVAPPGGGGPLGSRVFDEDPSVVTRYARAYVEAYEAAGVLTVLKHFPGHGAADGDSHDGPVAVAPSTALEQRDLVPYRELLDDAGGVMVSHVIVPDLSGLVPSSLSAGVVDGLLRQDLGWDGLVVTDSLSMGAVAASVPPTEAARLAIAAGADLALFVTVADPGAVLDRLVRAVQRGGIPAERVTESVGRVLAAKGVDPCAVEA